MFVEAAHSKNSFPLICTVDKRGLLRRSEVLLHLVVEEREMERILSRGLPPPDLIPQMAPQPEKERRGEERRGAEDTKREGGRG